MKKAIAAAALSMLMMFSLAACSSNENPDSTASNTIEESTAKTAEETAAEAEAIEKAARLEKKAQEGYDLFFENKYEEAVAAENEVIAEDPTFFKAYYIKGITQCYAGNYSEGSKNIDKALELNPDDYMARFNKALSLELYRYYDESLSWYEKSLEVANGQGEWSYYGIASIYGRRGDAASTVKYLRLAIDINPDIREEAKSESDFDPVRSSKEFTELIGE
ncbi:MAG: tetratricopeptide repeat protein [Firmicutes bacterium]|nr:tetratricopeptide repeat protein [Bacillota bacterium]